MKAHHSIALLWLCAAAAAGAQGAAVEPYRLTAVFQDSDTGRRFRDGILEAIAQVSPDPNAPVAHLEEVSYPNASKGLERLMAAIGDPRTHVVIGPTESGLYLRALEESGAPETPKVPVVSPMVTADVPFRDNGWFFRTNVNVERRAGAIYDFINKFWIQSIALLYANSEFGLRSEIAFQSSLTPRQRDLYLNLLFDSSARARDQIGKVLEAKPEAVGIFGERSEIADIYTSLQQRDSGPDPYRPLLFTLTDARFAGQRLEGLHIVSVTPSEAGDSYDDVKSLAFDTTLLILHELGRLSPGLGMEEQRLALRDRLEAALRWGATLEGTKTEFKLANHENITVPQVLRIDAEGNAVVALADQQVGWGVKLRKKLALARDRFGFWPFFNLIAILVIVVGVSVADVKKWYSGRAWALFRPRLRNYPFYVLVAVNALLVGGLYVFMAESGAISYGSTLAALAVAVAPLAALRVNLFETAAGKELGFGRYYESFLQWVNNKLMFIEHKDTKKTVHLVAYHNSVEGMKSYLRELYRRNRNSAQRIRLEAELEDLVNDKIPYAERRTLCARLLTRTVKWEDLQEDGLAPAQELDELEDPETLIRKAAQQCAGEPAKRSLLKDAIDEYLEKIDDKARRMELEAAFARDLQGIVGAQGLLRRELAFLFVLRGWDEEYLKKTFLSDDAPAEAKPEREDPPAGEDRMPLRPAPRAPEPAAEVPEIRPRKPSG